MADESGLPARRQPLDRAAMERVLARAAELQTADADPADAALNEDQLIEVAREVGLSPEHLKQALAEERSRAQVPDDQGNCRSDARASGPVAAARRVDAGQASLVRPHAVGAASRFVQRDATF